LGGKRCPPRPGTSATFWGGFPERALLVAGTASNFWNTMPIFLGGNLVRRFGRLRSCGAASRRPRSSTTVPPFDGPRLAFCVQRKKQAGSDFARSPETGPIKATYRLPCLTSIRGSFLVRRDVRIPLLRSCELTFIVLRRLYLRGWWVCVLPERNHFYYVPLMFCWMGYVHSLDLEISFFA